MAKLMVLTLERHPRLGPCFVMRFSWNARVENPIEEIKHIPASDRQYEAEQRRWWIAAKHVPVLATLFDNWHEASALLAGAQPETFSEVMSGVLKQRVLEALKSVLEACPAMSGDAIVAAVGDALNTWLDEYQQVPQTTSLTAGGVSWVHEMAARTRRDLPSWILRAAYAGTLLSSSHERPSRAPNSEE